MSPDEYATRRLDIEREMQRDLTLLDDLRDAEAAIARVRALCDESRVAISAGCWCDGEDDHEHTSRPLGWTLDPEQVIAALDREA